MSKWQEETAERNKQSLARLSKGLPTIFPPAVLVRALSRPFIPPTPRLAIDSYWREHPIRPDGFTIQFSRGTVWVLTEPQPIPGSAPY